MTGIILTFAQEARLKKLEQDEPSAHVVGVYMEPIIRYANDQERRVTATGRLLAVTS